MECFYITEADGLPLFRTASFDKETATQYYEAELTMQRYNDLTFKTYTMTTVLRTTIPEEAEKWKLKSDKFSKKTNGKTKGK